MKSEYLRPAMPIFLSSPGSAELRGVFERPLPGWSATEAMMGMGTHLTRTLSAVPLGTGVFGRLSQPPL